MPSAEKEPRTGPEPDAAHLDRLLATLGPGVLQLLAAPSGVEVPAASLMIHDPTDPLAIPRGALVLGVGLAPGRELDQLMQRVAAEGATLLVKATPAQHAQLAEDAERLGLTLVGVAHGADWMQIASLLRSAMVEDAVSRRGEELGGVAAGDLFAVANAVAALIDAPVTIEDPQARVLAYSARQDEADEARMVTILGRQVPDEFMRGFRSSGLFRRLYRDGRAIYLDDIAPGVLPRLAVAVKAGDEVLGSLWAAVREKPSDERIEDFARAASFVAIHLLRHRVSGDMQRGLITELLAAVLGGGPPAGDAAGRLGLRGDAFRVVAVAMREGDAVDNQLALARVWDTLSLHLSVVHRRAVSAGIEGVVYAVVPAPADAEGSRRTVREAVDGFVARVPAAVRPQIAVAIGGHAEDLDAVPRSRRDADRVLRVLRRSDAEVLEPAGVEEMHMQLLLDRLAEVGADEPIAPHGPLRRLIERDRVQKTELVESLRAYLDAFGDVAAAAGRLGIHHNTLRYRLQRLRETPGLDLDDPEQRLTLQLQLRWLGAEFRTRPSRTRQPRRHSATR